jgi:hypothetical protein
MVGMEFREGGIMIGFSVVIIYKIEEVCACGGMVGWYEGRYDL